MQGLFILVFYVLKYEKVSNNSVIRRLVHVPIIPTSKIGNHLTLHLGFSILTKFDKTRLPHLSSFSALKDHNSK